MLMYFNGYYGISKCNLRDLLNKGVCSRFRVNSFRNQAPTIPVPDIAGTFSFWARFVTLDRDEDPEATA